MMSATLPDMEVLVASDHAIELLEEELHRLGEELLRLEEQQEYHERMLHETSVQACDNEAAAMQIRETIQLLKGQEKQNGRF